MAMEVLVNSTWWAMLAWSSLLLSDHVSVRNRKVRLDKSRKVAVTRRPGIASLTVDRSCWLVGLF